MTSNQLDYEISFVIVVGTSDSVSEMDWELVTSAVAASGEIQLMMMKILLDMQHPNNWNQ